MEDENKLFNLFMHFGGLVLFNKIKDLIEQETRSAVKLQLQQRNEFQTHVINKVNNAGWDDESTHIDFIDFIRNEGSKIDEVADEFGIERDEI